MPSRSTTTSGTRAIERSCFLWQNREHFVRPADVPRKKPAGKSINIIGPTYGCFNSYSDIAELKRLLAGIGAEINSIFPFEACSYDTVALSDATATIVMYKEFGKSLAREVGLPAFDAPFGLEDTTAFLRGVGKALDLEAETEAFIALEKKTTLAAWQDIWRSTHSDFFANSPIAIVAPPSYKRRSRTLPRRRTRVADFV